MPIIEDLVMTSFELNAVRCTTKDYHQIEPAVHRQLLPNQYRASVGLHLTEEQCHLCDELATRNYMTSERTSALVALHYWVLYGGAWRDFNTWHLPWFKDLHPDGPHTTDFSHYSSYFSNYLSHKVYECDGSKQQWRTPTEEEMLALMLSDPEMPSKMATGNFPTKPKVKIPQHQHMWCLSSSLKRRK
jgi:hypothetical protein